MCEGWAREGSSCGVVKKRLVGFDLLFRGFRFLRLSCGRVTMVRGRDGDRRTEREGGRRGTTGWEKRARRKKNLKIMEINKRRVTLTRMRDPTSSRIGRESRQDMSPKRKAQRMDIP